MIDLIVALVLGSYLFTATYVTGVFLWFQRKYEILKDNHFQHLEDRVLHLEQAETRRTQAEMDYVAADRSERSQSH